VTERSRKFRGKDSCIYIYKSIFMFYKRLYICVYIFSSLRIFSLTYAYMNIQIKVAKVTGSSHKLRDTDASLNKALSSFNKRPQRHKHSKIEMKACTTLDLCDDSNDEDESVVDDGSSHKLRDRVVRNYVDHDENSEEPGIYS
jgi:hypothetical protein